MSFSLRSMFTKSDPQNVGAQNAAPSLNAVPTHIDSPQQPSTPMTPSGFQPAPPPFGGPLFRTLGNDDSNTEPLAFDPAQSPFSSPSSPSNVALTVADVLPQIPQEMARATAIPQDQPVQISPQILSHALSSGQLAVPLFEVYRVCPGIFQSPVSPDDTRMVRLPAAKLPALISAAMPPSTQPEVASASPFGTLFSAAPSTPPGPTSPFQSLIQPEPPTAPPAFSVAESVPTLPTSTVLPPRRDPSQPPANSLPPTPFLDLTATAPAQASPPPSPFGVMPAVSSPFGAPIPPATPSLFTAVPESPFATAPAAQEAAPPASPSPFASFSPSPEPEKAAAPSILQSIPAAKPMSPPAAQGKLTGPATASVAALLQGQSSDALGFDPGMVPSWISAQFNGGIIAELQEMPTPSLELGTIVDCITDVGFRNVLNSAQRNYQIAVSLSHFTPVSATTVKAAAATSTSVAATPTMVTPIRVTPVAPPSESATPSPFTVPSEAPETLANPFSVSPPETSPKAEPLNPFAAAPEPTPAAANPFSQPAESSSPPPSPFGASPLFASPLQPNPVTPAAPVFKIEPGNPFANVPEAPTPAASFVVPAAPPEPTPVPTLFTEAPVPAATPTPIQPKVDISSLFTAELAPAPTQASVPTEPPTPATAPPSPFPASLSFGAKAFDPFAPSDSTPSAPVGGGFTSFDLLGGAASAPEPVTPTEPTPALVVDELKSLPTDAVAPPEVAHIYEPEPLAAFKSPRFFIDSELEVEPEPVIIPEIPVVLEQPEPEPFTTSKATSWPDIAPIPAPEPQTVLPPLFTERTPSASKAPSFDPSPPEKVPLSPAMPTLAPTSRGIAPAKSSLGLSAMDRSGEEQLLLRALLDTDEDLSIERVIEMSSNLPGIAACALVRGNEVIAGSSTKGTDARAFLAQAADVAKSLRTLAPLIGISDAETFTLNTDSRLITLCFPGDVTLALLHDREPTLGLRDKLTLIARQLNSMVGKR